VPAVIVLVDRASQGGSQNLACTSAGIRPKGNGHRRQRLGEQIGGRGMIGALFKGARFCFGRAGVFHYAASPAVRASTAAAGQRRKRFLLLNGLMP